MGILQLLDSLSLDLLVCQWRQQWKQQWRQQWRQKSKYFFIWSLKRAGSLIACMVISLTAWFLTTTRPLYPVSSHSQPSLHLLLRRELIITCSYCQGTLLILLTLVSNVNVDFVSHIAWKTLIWNLLLSVLLFLSVTALKWFNFAKGWSHQDHVDVG